MNYADHIQDDDIAVVGGTRSSYGLTKEKGFWSRVRAEFLQPSFELMESDGLIMDVQRSFALQSPNFFVLVIKIMITGICLDTLVRDLVTYQASRSFYLAYLTHWGLVMAEVYILLSLTCTILGPRYGCNNSELQEESTTTVVLRSTPMSLLLRFTWAGFGLIATLQAVIVLLYWLLDYSPGDAVSYFGYMKHGGIFILVLLDGLVINHIPVRIQHLKYPMATFCMYLVWSLIHGLLTHIGNPNRNNSDPEKNGDDDAIYAVLNWKKRAQSTVIVFVAATFVVTPILFFIIYLLSWPMRRYVHVGEISSEASHPVVAMDPSSTFVGGQNEKSVVKEEEEPSNNQTLHQGNVNQDEEAPEVMMGEA